MSLNAVTDECVESFCNSTQQHLRSLTINGTTIEQLDRIIFSPENWESYELGPDDLSYFLGRITPSGFAQVVRLPHLIVLCLSSCDDVDDECVKSISTMTSLKHLSFIQCHNVKMSGLSSLSTMLQLERLVIKECKWMTDEHVIDMENRFSHVKFLEFIPTRVSTPPPPTRTVNVTLYENMLFYE